MLTDSDESLQKYLSGELLYGNDFTLEQITQWWIDEKDGYGGLVAQGNNYQYPYHELNKRYAYKYLPANFIATNVLGIGSAYGDEFLPIINKIKAITILEPSQSFYHEQLNSVPLTYLSPQTDGTIPFPDNSFNLIVCLSALHHVPNVSYIINEICRCTKQGGYIILREPIVSMREPIYTMEDWRKHKPGLTIRERGIPLQFIRKVISKLPLTILNEHVGILPTTTRLLSFMNKPVFNSKTALLFDEITSFLFRWNYSYHSYSRYNKIRPTQVVYALKKHKQS